MSKPATPEREAALAAFERHGGNLSAAARELGCTRSTVRHHVRKAGKDKKPLVGGSINGTPLAPASLPSPGQVMRYILTSAQNNTRLHDKVWENLRVLAGYYRAEILVGTFSYNKNAYGPLAVKRGTKGNYDRSMWYDERLEPYLCDKRVELAPGLVWCGEMNIMPTAEDPLEGLETYSGPRSSIFPHAKLAMRSVATMMDEPAKFLYTTGTVTQRNYLQKKAGLKAEHHHIYGGLLVEVNSDGEWWVRQLDADSKGRIQDLDVLVEKCEATAGHRVEAIQWGDLHASVLDESVSVAALGKGGMLDTLRPNYQFMHDIMEGVGTNHHSAGDPHERFRGFLRGLGLVELEGKITARMLKVYDRKGTTMVVVDSNHDAQWLFRWLREHDYRRHPENAVLFLEMQLAVYKALERNDKSFNIIEWLMRRNDVPDEITFLATDESFTIARGRIECGMHGHLGPNGARGTPQNLSKIGRRANIGHTHSAGIFNGLYVAGTSTKLDMGFNNGPSSWSHSHIVTYPTGKRAIVTLCGNRWRA